MKQLIEGNSILKVIPSDCHATGRPPVVHLRNNLTLDDGNFYQYPTLILGSAGSGKSTLMRQLAKPIFEHAKRNNDNVIVFCAKSDMPVINSNVSLSTGEDVSEKQHSLTNSVRTSRLFSFQL